MKTKPVKTKTYKVGKNLVYECKAVQKQHVMRVAIETGKSPMQALKEYGLYDLPTST